MPNFAQKMEDICNEINNMRYLYRESKCRTWKEFAMKRNLNYTMLSRWNRSGRKPNKETINDWARKCNVTPDYFHQDRPYLAMEELDYGHHLEHHTEKKYTIDEFINAWSMVAEGIELDSIELKHALERISKKEK